MTDTRDKLDQYLALKLAEQTGKPNGAVIPVLGPRPDRTSISANVLLHCDVPARDYLFANMLCTTSRWLINGATGVGKTLVGIDMAFAAANGANFLTWNGGRPGKVAYFDGELPFETLRERLEAARDVYGLQGETITVYNRDILEADGEEMPPFNTPEGQAWLLRELTGGQFAVAIFDNVATLNQGMMDEENWRAMVPLVRQISARRTAQVWLHHTGHDKSHGYGTSTREWQMDTVIQLNSADPDDPDNHDIRLEFTKARLRTPETAYLFAPAIITRDKHGWQAKGAPRSSGPTTTAERKRRWFLESYDELAVDAPLSNGKAGENVRKVAVAAIRDRMRNQGYLDSDKGKIPPAERMAFKRAREDLVSAKVLTCQDEEVWRIK